MMKENYALSASQINTFLKDPCVWVLKYYFGMSTGGNAYAIRGQAIEIGVDIFKDSGNIKAAEYGMHSYYIENTFDYDIELVNQQGELLNNWLRNSIDGLSIFGKESGVIEETQRRLEFEIEGLPFIGFLDYSFKDRNVDLKTTGKLPKILTRGARKGMLEAFKKDNLRQQSIYMYTCGGILTTLLYTTPNNIELPLEERVLHYTLTKEECNFYMDEVKEVVKEIKKCLTGGLEYAKLNYKPNKSLMGKYSFYYDEAMTEKVKEVWG